MRTLKLRVSGVYRPGEHVFSSAQLPYLPLEGSWLAEVGFPVGTRVRVEAVEDGRLVLTRMEQGEAESGRSPERWALTEKGVEAARKAREEVAVHA